MLFGHCTHNWSASVSNTDKLVVCWPYVIADVRPRELSIRTSPIMQGCDTDFGFTMMIAKGKKENAHTIHQSVTNPPRVFMWPPPKSRTFLPTVCLPGPFWGHFKPTECWLMCSWPCLLSLRLWKSLKTGQIVKTRTFLAPVEGKSCGRSPLPFTFLTASQWKPSILFSLPVPLYKN